MLPTFPIKSFWRDVKGVDGDSNVGGGGGADPPGVVLVGVGEVDSSSGVGGGDGVLPFRSARDSRGGWSESISCSGNSSSIR